MNRSDKIMRMIAFYTAVALFFIILPILLSYSLGYKIDYKAVKIYKTGIIYISSRPSGASIYMNGKLHKDLTPAQIEELKPGNYKVEVKRAEFYPWEGELTVRPNMVTRADGIILFPVTRDIVRLSERDILDFAVSDKGAIYYFTRSGLYRGGPDKNALKKISSYSNWPDRMTGKKFSPDGNKLLCFDKRSVLVADLNPDKSLTQGGYSPSRVEEVFKSPEPLIDVFWHPGLGYAVAVTEKDIKIIELRVRDTQNVVSIYVFAATPQNIYYDGNTDSLYFTDTGTGANFNAGKHLYRIDLRQTFFGYLKEFLMKREIQAPRQNGKK